LSARNPPSPHFLPVLARPADKSRESLDPIGKSCNDLNGFDDRNDEGTSGLRARVAP
jgi:hypothetical protein